MVVITTPVVMVVRAMDMIGMMIVIMIAIGAMHVWFIRIMTVIAVRPVYVAVIMAVRMGRAKHKGLLSAARALRQGRGGFQHLLNLVYAFGHGVVLKHRSP